MKILFASVIAVCSLAAVSCGQPKKKHIPAGDTRAARLERSTPEAEGAPSRAVLGFLEKAKEAGLELHSFMLVKNGKVICEKWWEPYAPQYRHTLYSLSKSFTSIAVGMAMDEGLLALETPLSQIFAREFSDLGAKADDRVRRMTIRNLLTMSTGMESEYWAWDDPSTENNIISFLSGPLKDDPGQAFRYSTIATYMLSAAVTRVTGKTLVEYLEPRLFSPLGIDYDWELDGKTGVNMGGFGLSVATEDIAKFGQMVLQKGMWEGRRLVSENWIAEATKKQISTSAAYNDDGGDWAVGYGYQFWQCKPEGVFRGDGASGQFCVVAPSQDMIIAVTANVQYMDQLLDLFWEMLDKIKALPADGDGAKELAAYTGLTYLLTDEDTQEYPAFSAEYKIEGGRDPRRAYIGVVRFAFKNNECTMSLYNNEDDEQAHVTYLFTNGKWGQALAPSFLSYEPESAHPIVTNGVWKDNVFTATTWYCETALRREYRFTFGEDFSQIAIESRYQTYSPFEPMGKGARK